MRRIIQVCVLSFVVVILSGLAFRAYRERNPLQKYGVHIKWKHDTGAATSSYDWIEVWCDFEGKKINCPIEFGAIANADLSFEDRDGDGIPDIVFSNGRNREVVAFKPAAHGKTPFFVVLENNPESK